MARLYHFFFDGIEQKITIQAQDKQRARQLLYELRDRLPAEYQGKDVVDETTEALITGVTERVMNGKKCVWTGSRWRPVS